MTYLVMECHPSYVIVLDQAGRMLKVANMGYEVGQKVEDVIVQRNRPMPLRLRFAPLAAAACICLAVMGGGAYGACYIPYGTVQLKINPDVRMAVSYMDRVVGLEGLNEDGAKLIDQVSYRGKDAEEMTGILVERAVELGYLSDGGTVSVAAAGRSERWKEKREMGISSKLENMLAGRMHVEIYIGDAEDKNAGDTSHGQGMETIPQSPAAVPAKPPVKPEDASAVPDASVAPTVPAAPAVPAAPVVPAGAPLSPAAGAVSPKGSGWDEDDDWDEDEDRDKEDDRDGDDDGDKGDDREEEDWDENEDRDDEEDSHYGPGMHEEDNDEDDDREEEDMEDPEEDSGEDGNESEDED